MNMQDKQVYIKEIVEEYGVRFKSWGDVASWPYSRFTSLEKMIFDKTHIRVSATTLQRLFRQETGNPQMATCEALCRFLGYEDYSDFILKRGQKEVRQAAAVSSSPSVRSGGVNLSHASRLMRHLRRRNRYYVAAIAVLAVALCAYLLWDLRLADRYHEHLLRRIEFSASQVKGACPLTVTFSYDIPEALFPDMSLLYGEANGDTQPRPLAKAHGSSNTTYIYEGEGYAALMYKGREVRRIRIEVRRPGWSVFAHDERMGLFKALPWQAALNPQGCLSLPPGAIGNPELEKADHLFVSYTYYRPGLVDGDAFELEARVRNSSLEHAIPCADVMMYLYADAGMHGFAMNEHCFAYLKFISGDREIKGTEYDLSHITFSPEQWHVMKIRVADGHTVFYIDGEQVLDTRYERPVGQADEVTLRFKGCGAVDYVQLSRADGTVMFRDDFGAPPSGE